MNFFKGFMPIFVLALVMLTSCEREELLDTIQELKIDAACQYDLFLAEPFDDRQVGDIIVIGDDGINIGGKNYFVNTQRDTDGSTHLWPEVGILVDATGNSFILRLSNAPDNGEGIVIGCSNAPIAPPNDIQDFLGTASSLSCAKVLQQDMQSQTDCSAALLQGDAVTVSGNGIDVGNACTFVFDDEGQQATVYINGEPFRLLFEVAPVGQLRITCETPPGVLVNQAQDLLNMQSAMGCGSLELPNAWDTPNGTAPVGTMVIFTSTTVTVVGYYTYTIDVNNGIPTDFAFGLGLFEIPLENGPGGQILLECSQAPSLLPDESQDLVDAQANTSNCVELESLTPMPTPNGTAPVGTIIAIDPSAGTVTVGNIYVFNINTDASIGVNVEFGFGNQTFDIPLENAEPNLQILLECKVPIGTLPNEAQDLADAQANTNDCMELELATPMPTPNGTAPVGTISAIDPSAGTVTVGNIYVFNINTDASIGVNVEFGFGNQTFDIPLENAEPNLQILLECHQTTVLPNQFQELKDDIAATPNCNMLFLESGLFTPNSMFAPSQTEVTLSLSGINIVGYYTWTIDSLNGTVTEVTYNGNVYLIPLANGPLTQIRLECEQPVTVTVPVLNERYELLISTLGWNGQVLPISNEWFLQNSCDEIRYQLGSIDAGMRFIVEIDSGAVVKYGIELDNNGTITQHWIDGNGTPKKLIYNGVWHTSRYLPALPGSGDADVICQ